MHDINVFVSIIMKIFLLRKFFCADVSRSCKIKYLEDTGSSRLDLFGPHIHKLHMYSQSIFVQASQKYNYTCV